MPKKLAVHFECERCPRSWFEDYEEGQPMPESTLFAAELRTPGSSPLRVEFGVLCTSCEKTIANAFEAISKTNKKSPERGAKKEDSEESPEVNVVSPTDTS